MEHLSWRTSSYSGNGNNCVEVAPDGGSVLVRDTKDRSGPVLTFTAVQWTAFLAEVATDAPNISGTAVAEPEAKGGVALRRSDSPALFFTPSEWAAFRSGVRGGEFDAFAD